MKEFWDLLRRNPFYAVAGPLFFLDAIFAVVWSVQGHFVVERTVTWCGIAHLVIWSLGPPLWFFIEYHVVPVDKLDLRKQTKDSQDVAGKIWAAVIVIMSFFISNQLRR